MKPISIIQMLTENYEHGKVAPSFDDRCEAMGIPTVSPLYYVNGVPESCKTIEDADKYYASLPDGSSVNYSNDKGNLTQEQYDFLNSHREEVRKALGDFSSKMANSGSLDEGRIK